MTCIAAVADGRRVWIGGDSAGVAGWSLNLRADEKVFTNGPFIMGFTDSFRMGQLLRYALKAPDLPNSEQTDRYMVTSFVDAVRDCLKAGGVARKNTEAEECGTFIVGVRGQIYTVQSDYQVAKPLDDYAAVGRGADIALGSLYSARALSPEQRIRTALEAAEAHCGAVRRPFVVRHNGITVHSALLEAGA